MPCGRGVPHTVPRDPNQGWVPIAVALAAPWLSAKRVEAAFTPLPVLLSAVSGDVKGDVKSG